MLEQRHFSVASGNGDGEADETADAARADTGLDAAARRNLLSESVEDGEAVEEAQPLVILARREVWWKHVLLATRPAPAVDADPRRLIAPGQPEPRWKRWLYVAVAITLAYLHFDFTSAFWAPAHWGNNQNGYLVGARNLATTLRTTGFEPTSPFEFVGWMWVMGDETSTAAGGGMHYPKYPLGVPLAQAIVYRVGLALYGPETAIEWVFRVSPVAMALALLGTFFLTRELASSFAGLLAMILLGTLPLVLILSNNPNSHAMSLCFICWGMYALVRWWETLSWWRGLIAGFLLGYAVTIRYTEGLLLLPMMVAGLLAVRYRPRWLVSWWRAGVWLVAACAAVVIHDSLGRDTFAWQQWLTTKIGPNLLWWQRAILVALPILITIRWTELQLAFKRDALLAGEWLRTLACAGIVLAASTVSLPQLESSTPPSLHLLRLLAIVGFFGVYVLLMHLIRWREPRTWLPSATLAMGWLFPVAVLLVFNQLTVGTFTGYDTTNESSGFTWRHFTGKWQNTLDQLYNQGLYFILPLGVLGLYLAFRWSWRAALLLSLWFIPGTLLYMAYYYGRGMPLIGYLRFFTSMLPAAVVAAVWLIHKASVEMQQHHGAIAPGQVDSRASAWRGGRTRGSIAAPLAAGLFVALPATMNLDSMLGPLERDAAVATNLADVGRRAREAIPENAIIFGHSQRLLNYLQFAGKDSWKYYGADYFRNGFPVPSIGSRDPDDPNPIQPARREFLRRAYDGLDNREMVRVQNEIMTGAIAEGKRVFVILDTSQLAAFRRAFLSPAKFQTQVIRSWREPASMSSLARRSLAGLGADMHRGSQQRFQIVEVTLKPPRQPASTAPSTNPATGPSTAADPKTW